MKNTQYAIPEYLTAEEIKEIRKKMKLTQKEFAELLGLSKPTIERYETSEALIKGPIVLALFLLSRDSETIENLIIPEKKYPLRLKYMYKQYLCTVIDVDEINQKVSIHNYTNNLMFRAFGINEKPSFDDFNEFLKSRCFPETRDKIKLVLKDLGIPFYDPLLIIKKTEGRMAEDDFWIKME